MYHSIGWAFACQRYKVVYDMSNIGSMFPSLSENE